MRGLVAFGVFVVVVSAVGAAWRTRPQHSSPRGELRFAAVVAILAFAGAVSSGPRLGPFVLAAAPVAACAGWVAGRLLGGTMRFWNDAATGRPMFSGGAVYFFVLAASAMTRVTLRYFLTGSIVSHSDPSGFVPQASMVLAGALLFADAGLYLARAQAIATAAGERMTVRWLRLAGGA